MIELPDFRLETYLEEWEFTAKYHLTASDAESMTIDELLELASPHDRAAFEQLSLTYRPTAGDDELRAAIAATYERCTPEDILCFAGAEEAMFWTLTELSRPGDHAVVTVPNYQSMEELPRASGADVTGVSLTTSNGWTFDLDEVLAALSDRTRLVAVNFPNNPTGYIPGRETFAALVRTCDERGIRLFSDEVYRGVELDPARRLPQAADMSERAISLNVMSKAYGLPGLRIGWIACRDRELLDRLRRRKHYTSICNAGPSELLATIALRNSERILERNRGIIAANLPVFDGFFSAWQDLFDWYHPDGGCVVFPRYLGDDGVEMLCRHLVEQEGVVLLPAGIYASEGGDVPSDRFRMGVGRRDPEPALEAFDRFLQRSR